MYNEHGTTSHIKSLKIFTCIVQLMQLIRSARKEELSKRHDGHREVQLICQRNGSYFLMAVPTAARVQRQLLPPAGRWACQPGYPARQRVRVALRAGAFVPL